MKIGIWDGCANGGMMDSLSIHEYEEGNGEPYAIAEISEKKWAEWQAFLKEHNKWELFWDRELCKKENRNHGR